MSEQIKPCPFCGPKGDPRPFNGGPLWYVMCLICGVVMGHFGSESTAIGRWNRRAGDTRP